MSQSRHKGVDIDLGWQYERVRNFVLVCVVRCVCESLNEIEKVIFVLIIKD